MIKYNRGGKNMKNLSIAVKIAIGFIIILLLFALVSVVSLYNMKKAQEDARWVEHTYEVLAKIESVLSEFKDAETGQRGYLITGQNHYLGPYNSAMIRVESKIRELQNLTLDNNNQQQRIVKLEALRDKKFEELKQTIELRKTSGFNAAKELVISDIGKKVMDEIRGLLDEMTNEENQLLKERILKNERTSLVSKKMVIGIPLAAMFIVILLILYFTKTIAYPIKKISLVAEGIASGDLTGKVDDSVRRDELGMLIRAVRRMSDNLHKQVSDINVGVNVISSSASEIMASISQLASGAAETASSISETTTTIAEVKQTAEISNQKAIKISDGGQENIENSQKGKKSIQEALQGMNRIKEQMISIADIVIRLSDQSQIIGEITSSVNDLAEQSNLLAVNASIEAAKAGEHGKGFTVVAQEIKNLASRSKESTKQIKTILGDIQKSISATVMAAEQGGKAVDEGLKLSLVAGDVISSLALNIEEFAQAGFQIASSSQQQLVGMDQINEAMEDIKQASIQTAASTRQTEESVTDLHKLGEKLQDILRQYKLE